MPAWLCPNTHPQSGDSGIVISTRIRLARNIAGFPFPNRCTENDRKSVRSAVHKATESLWQENTDGFLDIEKLEPLDRLFLLERQLISKELAEISTLRSGFIAEDEAFCVMVNEEDHLRIHCLSGGFELDNVWQIVNDVDDQLESQLEYVFDKQYGYLTSCPSNAGTGMRVSVMLHLPALAATKEMDSVFRSLQKVYLTVRGLYGEGSQAFGELFQVSNQMTLGKNETDIMDSMRQCIPQIIEYERKARDYLLSEKNAMIQDRCCRALGVLQTSRMIGNTEAMNLLSSVRLGIHTGILDTAMLGTISLANINTLLLHIQPAHLQKLAGRNLDPTEQDVERSKRIRLTFGGT
ncbi:MAG: protein arginine kinase [Planctomycetaceae bacterium]|nr:protein arginine kinase [Planctomycetaceae bacterium]